MAEYTHIVQPFEPVYDENSEILILGSQGRMAFITVIPKIVSGK